MPYSDEDINKAVSLALLGEGEPIQFGPPSAYDPQEINRAVKLALGGAEFNFGADAPSYLGGFIKTAVHGGTSGLIGRDPDEAFWDPETVSRFHQTNPFSAIMAEIIGSAPIYAVPYAGAARGGGLGLRLASKLPGASRIARFAMDPVAGRARPVATAAAREVARFLPLETARVAGAAIDQAVNEEGDDGIGNVMGQIAFELPAIAATGAVAKVLRARGAARGRKIGEEQQIQDAFEFYNLNGTKQERLRQLWRGQEILHERAGLPSTATMSADNVTDNRILDLNDLLGRVRQELETEILTEAPPAPNTYIHRLIGEDERRAASKNLNAMLRVERTDKHVQTRTFDPAGAYGKSLEATEDMATAGIGRGDLPYIQYPRSIQTSSPAGSARVEAALRGFKRAGSRNGRVATWVARETDGLYVVVKRVANRPRVPKSVYELPKNSVQYQREAARFTEEAIREAERAASYGDRYVVFKTDNPLRFHKGAQKVVENLNRAFKPLRPPSVHALEPQVPILRMWRELEKAMPMLEELVGAPKRAVARFLRGRMSEEVAATADTIGKSLDYLGAELKAPVAPGLYQFNKSKRAMRMNSMIRGLYNRLNADIQTKIYGPKDPAKAGTLFGQLFEIPNYKGGVWGPLQELDADEMVQLSKALDGMMSIDEARAANFSKKVVDWLRAVARLDKRQNQDLKNLLEIAKDHGITMETEVLAPLENHYGITRSWRGSFRQEIVDEAGELVGLGSGYNAAQARADAEALVAAARGDGHLFRLSGDAFWTSRDQDLIRAAKINITGNEAIKKAKAKIVTAPPASKVFLRGKSLGAVGQFQPYTKKELLDILIGNVTETSRMQAQLTIQLKLGDELAKLSEEYPALHRQLVDRINARAGHRVKGDRAVIDKLERGIDRVLGPFLGNNSATRIANGINEAMFHLTLLMGDMGFVALNALTPVMTGLPELAYLLTAPPARLAKDYTAHFVMGRSGGMKHFYSLDPLKVLMRSMREMTTKNPRFKEQFERAIREGIIDPKFVEEFTGAGQAKLFGLHAKDLSYTEWLRRLVEFPAAKSEEFSRGLSFQMGLNAAEDYFGKRGEDAYQFAREFVERTQYLYQTADRGQIITGPLGKVFGLFKNWSMHQLATLARYNGEAWLDGNFAPLLWGALATGGIAGAPGVAGYSVADKFSKIVSDKPLMQNTYEALGYEEGTPQALLTDTLFYGLPGGLFGMTLQGRAAQAGADPIRDLTMLGNIALLDRAKWGAEFLGEAFNRASTSGTHPINSRDVWDKFLRFAAPRSIYRYASMTHDGYLKSLKTQGKLVGDFSTFDQMLYALGMPPIEVDKYYAVANEAWDRQGARAAAISAYGDALAEARAAGDWEAMRRVMGGAMSAGVPLDSVVRSADIRNQVQHEAQMERYFQDAATQAHRRAIGVPR